MVKVEALKDVVIPGGVQLVRGKVAEIDGRLVEDLVRAGYVSVIEMEPEEETAALEGAPERAVKSKGRRKKAGGEL